MAESRESCDAQAEVEADDGSSVTVLCTMRQGHGEDHRGVIYFNDEGSIA